MDTIKSLEDRIKERAKADFEMKVEDVMRRVRSVAGGALEKPVMPDGTLSIKQAIDAVYAAIIREQGPVVASKALDDALDDALEDLARQLEPSQLIMPGQPRAGQ